MGKKIAFILLVIAFCIACFNPNPYKQIIYDILELFFKFYIPALFTTLFLIKMIFKTNVLQELSIKHQTLATILSSTLIIFGGTPIFLGLSNELEISKKSKEQFFFIGPSFSFIYYAFFPFLGYKALLLALFSILLRLFFFLIFFQKLTFKNDNNAISFYDSFLSSTKETIASLFNLILIVCSISVFVPLLSYFVNQNILMCLRGIIEYSMPTKYILNFENLCGKFIGIFIMEFNGLCSYLACKKVYKNINLFKTIGIRAIYSVFSTTLIFLVFKCF